MRLQVEPWRTLQRAVSTLVSTLGCTVLLALHASAAIIADYQVLQRGPDGKATVAGRSGTPITLNTGGPYRVETSDGVRNHIYVGDIWILAGQSNMVGRAKFAGADGPDERVRVLPKSGVWDVAREPLHELRIGLDGEQIGAGLGLPFAKEMVRRTGVPIGLLPVAVGGTSIWRWDPDDPKSLYAAMLERVQQAGGRVRGVLWAQGEADAREKSLGEYAARFRRLLTALRRDLRDEKLPFYYVQIGRYPFEDVPERSSTSMTEMRELLRSLETELSGVRMAATVDLELEDHVHYNRASQQRLGHRLANLACHDMFPAVAECRAISAGPRFDALRWESPRRLIVKFSGVNGSLRPHERVLGFSITDNEGKELPRIFRAWVPEQAGNEVVLQVNAQLGFPPLSQLWYGRGFDPSCNLTDDRDMAAPAFGPIALKPPVDRGTQ